MANDTLNQDDTEHKGMHYDFTPSEVLALDTCIDATCELVELTRRLTKEMAKYREIDMEVTKTVLRLGIRIDGLYNNYNYQFGELNKFNKTLKEEAKRIANENNF